jgi:ribonucleoside-diphosphate reductase alpha chain
MRVEFESSEAELINEKIFESIYFGAVSASVDQAEKYGHYTTYPGSPTSEGLLQFDLWNYKPRNGYDWDAVKLKMKKFGIRNSLLIAPMPTASTSQILGNNESFEPYTSNLYTRRGFLFFISVLSGEFVCINSHLVTDLIKLNLWNPQIKNKLI